MTKRTPARKRNPDEFWPTPFDVTERVVPFLRLEEGFHFAEPCVGDRDIASILEWHGFVSTWESDLRQGPGYDARTVTIPEVDFIVTNPPWDRTRRLLHEIMAHLIDSGKPVWLLLPLDWLANQNSAHFIRSHLTDIVMVGRVKWIPDSDFGGMDNVMWARFRQACGGAGVDIIPQRKRRNAETSP